MTFEAIYREYWEKIYRLCRGYVGDPDKAKDMAQETFVIVLRQLPKFRGESSVGTWIFRIACNCCLRELEKGRRDPQVRLQADIADVSVFDHRAEQSGSDRRDELAFLYRCLAELPETDRLLIGLELEGVPQAQIAGILGLTETNTRVRLFRIREKIKQKFNGYEHR